MRPARVQPLPGILDHWLFERTKVALGRCEICGAKKVIYRSREAQAKEFSITRCDWRWVEECDG